MARLSRLFFLLLLRAAAPVGAVVGLVPLPPVLPPVVSPLAPLVPPLPPAWPGASAPGSAARPGYGGPASAGIRPGGASGQRPGGRAAAWGARSGAWRETETRLLDILHSESLPPFENSDRLPKALRHQVAASVADHRVAYLLSELERAKPTPANFDRKSLVGDYCLEYTTELPNPVRREVQKQVNKTVSDISMMMSIKGKGAFEWLWSSGQAMEMKAKISLLDGQEKELLLKRQIEQNIYSPHFRLTPEGDDVERSSMQVRYISDNLLVTERVLDEDDLVRQMLESSGVFQVFSKIDIWRRLKQPSLEDAQRRGRAALWRFGLPNGALPSPVDTSSPGSPISQTDGVSAKVPAASSDTDGLPSSPSSDTDGVAAEVPAASSDTVHLPISPSSDTDGFTAEVPAASSATVHLPSSPSSDTDGVAAEVPAASSATVHLPSSPSSDTDGVAAEVPAASSATVDSPSSPLSPTGGVAPEVPAPSSTTVGLRGSVVDDVDVRDQARLLGPRLGALLVLASLGLALAALVAILRCAEAGRKRRGGLHGKSSNAAGVQLSALPRGKFVALRRTRQGLCQNPGRHENAKFECDASVSFWADFGRTCQGIDVQENLRYVAKMGKKYLADGPEAAAYWAKNAVRSVALHGGLEWSPNASSSANAAFADESGSMASTTDASKETAIRIDDASALAGLLPPIGVSPEMETRLLLEASLTYEQDWKRIHDGVYKAPWDTEPTHRPTYPRNMLLDAARFARDKLQTLARRAESVGSMRVPWLGSSRIPYPAYYNHDFHYETDGLLSQMPTKSVPISQLDAMQRGSLLPLRDIADANGGAPRILEVACGTGRFATFIRDNHPKAKLTLVDISPFYLQKARENDAAWRRCRRKSERLWSPRATFVHAAAEDLPFADASFDAVVCGYLFREMSEDARAAAACEFARVCAPGGIVVLTDSIQEGDRPALFGKLDFLSEFNEPYYSTYIRSDLPALFEEHGLQCTTKTVACTSKTLAFRRPCVELRTACAVVQEEGEDLLSERSPRPDEPKSKNTTD